MSKWDYLLESDEQRRRLERKALQGDRSAQRKLRELEIKMGLIQRDRFRDGPTASGDGAAREIEGWLKKKATVLKHMGDWGYTGQAGVPAELVIGPETHTISFWLLSQGSPITGIYKNGKTYFNPDLDWSRIGGGGEHLGRRGFKTAKEALVATVAKYEPGKDDLSGVRIRIILPTERVRESLEEADVDIEALKRQVKQGDLAKAQLLYNAIKRTVQNRTDQQYVLNDTLGLEETIKLLYANGVTPRKWLIENYVDRILIPRLQRESRRLSVPRSYEDGHTAKIEFPHFESSYTAVNDYDINRGRIGITARPRTSGLWGAHIKIYVSLGTDLGRVTDVFFSGYADNMATEQSWAKAIKKIWPKAGVYPRL